MAFFDSCTFVLPDVSNAASHQRQKGPAAVQVAELGVNGHKMIAVQGSHGVQSPSLLPLSVEAFRQSLDQLMSKHMAHISHSVQEALETPVPHQ